MKSFTINHISPAKNKGIAREHDLCAYMGIERSHHDSGAYDKGSDIELGEMLISVKASGFTLISGKYATDNGLTTYEEIMDFYMATTHSNLWAYVTADYKVYMMNRSEFIAFCANFCGTEKESAKNGGGLKIRCKKESGKMLEWLEAHIG